jgi:hypothetical protein
MRKRIIVLSVIYKDILVQRWLCRNLNSNRSQHRTFSLLPQMLAPYYKQDINSILETADYKSNHSYEQTKNHVQQKTDISLEHSQINNINTLIQQTFVKISAIDELNSMMTQSTYFNSQDPISTTIKFIKTYKSSFSSTIKLTLSNAEQLALDFFFHFQTTAYFQRDFLFGTPSQKTVA